jgi:hypothetical protein
MNAMALEAMLERLLFDASDVPLCAAAFVGIGSEVF